MKNKFLISLLIFHLLFSVYAIAQHKPDSSVIGFPKEKLNWFNADLKEDKKAGVSVNKAYNSLLKGKKTKKTIVVAIIDSGVDIDHEDLKGRIWVNEKEIPANGIDDDNNGYVDDIYGWGFLGNKKGENVDAETYEFVRIYRKLDPLFNHYSFIGDVPFAQQKDYELYLKVKSQYEEKVKKYNVEKASLTVLEKLVHLQEQVVLKYLGTTTYTVQDLKEIKSDDPKVKAARDWLLGLYKKGYNSYELEEYQKVVKTQLEENLNVDYNPRTIIGDNIEDINDRNYGNNDVKGPRPDHGTPVSGVIGAVRGNDKGIDGIAEDVRFMAIRAVPNGDEYDKDIALAIRYAVDNGANVINMSFGKEFSPQKKMVDDAIKYAEAHNVLLVHAAGNSSYNIDEIIHYPSKTCLDSVTVTNWIEVGANNIKADKNLCATFTNYGKHNVELFAPGVDIVSLADGNKYTMVDGTSFAGPVVSGVAALIWSYYPELTAVELKDIIIKSTTDLNKKKVTLPGAKPGSKKVAFSTLSSTGGIVNAYKALLLAEKVVKEKK